MKMAKATEQDIEAAGTALGVLNTIASGYYPGTEDDAPLHFDPEDRAHLSLFYRLMVETLDKSPGWQNRVIGGMCYVILFDKNEIIDPASNCLELHPRFARVQAELDAAREALREIALAGMSGTGQESEEGMQAWHARRAWEFIGIAARALSPATGASHG